ncbi:MAG: potassium channel family protein [Thermoproteota archaeon]|nr:potassium channel family protein [Thermoproteota archaeon]
MTAKIETVITILVGISVIFIVIDYIYKLSSEQELFIYVFDLAIVAILIADFYRRLLASGEGYKRFTLKHWYEIPAMLPVVLFALLETHTVIGAALRGIGLIPLFRLVRFFFRTTTIFQRSKLAYLIAFSSGSIIVGAFAEFIVESPNPDSKITNLGEAFWWAIVTVTTVGYGDVYPITIEGKIIASVLMIVGIGVLGTFISTLGAALIESRLRIRHDLSVEYKSGTNKEGGGEEELQKSDADISDGGHTIGFTTEAKAFIKHKIDEIEKMNEQEINMLIDMIRTIHNSKANTNKEDTNLHPSKD